MEKLRARRREGETSCPYCHGELGAEDQVVACGGCATVYHSDCLRDELKGCATLGCQVRPELGKAFAWGERGPLRGMMVRPGEGLTCCSTGASKADEPIHVCQGCGSLSHASCLERRGPCCPGELTVPLLGVRDRSADKLLLHKSLRAWLAVLLIVFVSFLIRLFYFGAGAGEIVVFAVGILILVAAGLYALTRQLKR